MRSERLKMKEESYNREEFEKMEEYIEHKRRLGKVPLFIIGAGVSAGKVPLMNDIFGYFANIRVTPEDNDEIKNIKTYAQRLYKNKKYQTVSASAHLFNILQNSKNPATRNLWKQFTRDFLMGKIGEGEKIVESRTTLWDLVPSDFHMWVAEQIVRDYLPAFCISLNYDGLTAKAIAAIANDINPKDIDSLYPCRILSTPEEIDEFWSSNRTKSDIYPLIKLKGDIFYALCSNEGCRFHTHPVPTYEFLHERKKWSPPHKSLNSNENNPSQESLLLFNENKNQNVLIVCPECGSEMKLDIDFPGYQKKESHSRRLIERIYRYIVPFLSCIIVCGVSGKWDREIVEFLRFCANEKGLEIYCFSHTKRGFPALRYELSGIEEDKFKHIYFDFRKWSRPNQIKKRDIKSMKSVTSKGNYSLLDDHLWLLKGQSFELNLSRDVKSEWLEKIEQEIPETQKIEFRSIGDDETRDLLTRSLHGSPTYKLMRRIYQLGIKDILLGKERAIYHTRKSHAYGARLIGLAWWESIAPFVNLTNFRFMDREKRVRCLELALLLHDAGHLPFSHLMEEIYRELNWTRIAQSAKHRHDENPLEQISEEDKGKLKSAFKEILNIPENEIQDYYNFVQDLIAGVSGIPFLDAIVNSPLDADKIDYIFRDTEFTKKSTRLSEKKEWLESFLSSISLSQEGLIRLNGESAIRARELLEERQFLYRNLYLRPDIRAFEKITATIIITWLTSRVSKHIKHIKVDLSELQWLQPDLREYKGKKAYALLLEEFNKALESATPLPDEFDLLLRLCDNLVEERDKYFVSEKAAMWFGELKNKLERIKDAGNNAEKELKKQFSEMIVEDPFYIPIEKTEDAKEIARRLYIDYPCSVLIDIVEFPKFLPSSRARRFKKGKIVGECFLVPNINPRNWSTKSIARVPLHECDFKDFETPLAQIVIIDTVPEEGRGQFICQLFKDHCRSKGIEIIGGES